MNQKQYQAEQGRAIVEWNTNQRHVAARSAASARNAHHRDASEWAQLSSSSARRLRGHYRDEAWRAIYAAPVRLSDRLDVLRYAQDLTRWAVEVQQNTNWNSMACGDDDALDDRLTRALEDAKCLRAYAEVMEQ